MCFAITVMICALLVGSCSSEASCQNQLLDRSLSPDGQMVAFIFSRNCGATVGENYQVSVVPRCELSVGKGNILVADQAPPYSDRFKPVWNGKHSVTVPIPSGARIFTKGDNANGIQVVFRQM